MKEKTAIFTVDLKTKNNFKFFTKTIDKPEKRVYNTFKFEYHNNDFDEDGRIADP